jgi:hypothetical protein
LRSFFFASSDPSVNVVGGTSPSVIHFFFQYWTGLPFGLGILFLPLVVIGLWKAVRTWTWPVIGTVLFPFLVFAIFWGSFSSGLAREGLHAVILAMIVVIALEQKHQKYSWLRFLPTRLVLALRSVEVLVLATVPVVATRHRLLTARFALTDVMALVTMAFLCGLLGWFVWRENRAGAITSPHVRSGMGPIPGLPTTGSS